MAQHKITVPGIVTPCHGAPLMILTTYDGREDVPNEILCSVEGCYNTWDATGQSDEFNRMPGA